MSVFFLIIFDLGKGHPEGQGPSPILEFMALVMLVIAYDIKYPLMIQQFIANESL